MKTVFIGASKFGMRCLDQLIDMSCCDIVGAVTTVPTFSISYRPEGVTNVLFADIKNFCDTHGINCLVMKHGMQDPLLFNLVKTWSPEMFIVAGWYHMLPKSWRELAPAYGLHASLLPDYSGGAPLVWAMINGEKRTGITFFQFDDGVDSGPLVGQAETEILEEDTIATLYERIEGMGISLLKEHLPSLAAGTAVLARQDESKRRIFPQRGPEDGRIDWKRPANEVHDFIKAQTRPYPGAFSFFNGKKIMIWESRKHEYIFINRSPGEIITDKHNVVVICNEGKGIEIISLAEDSTDITVESWLHRNHQHLDRGSRFE